MAQPKIEHLYIHIPFCKGICTYCDFVRFVANQSCADKYVNDLIKQFKKKYTHHKFKTIYIGGGTPNHLSAHTLNKLLSTLAPQLSKEYEFTIECNPELLSLEQAVIFKTNKVNRASIGVQTVNNTILKKFHRQHTLKDVQNAIANLRKVGIANISCDFIYGFNELNDTDIYEAIKFIKTYHIPHVSWYALEVKVHAIINLQGYKLNDDLVDHQLALIIKRMRDIKYKRYEVSSWAKSTKYESDHNKAYWLSKPWGALGLGASGFDIKSTYVYTGNLNKYIAQATKLSNKDYYFQIMMMGLRLSKGLDLSVPKFQRAYKYFKNKLKHVHVKNNYLCADNINLLDNILLELM